MMLVTAALAYACGGLFMKQSDGVQRLLPTLCFVGLFVAGSTLQAVGMKNGEMGVSYVVVLGVEAVLAMLLSVLVLGEALTLSRAAATAVIVAGIAWLQRT